MLMLNNYCSLGGLRIQGFKKVKTEKSVILLNLLTTYNNFVQYLLFCFNIFLNLSLKAEFSAAVSATCSFRNHSNKMICSCAP